MLAIKRRWMAGWLAGAAALAGCTAESTRLAIDTQQRANQVDEALFTRQHDALRGLLYRDCLRRLESAGAALNDAQKAALSDAWNERDLIEFWLVQHERSKALRLVGVDTKLYGGQAVVDLLWKAVSAKVDRAEQAAAAAAGEAAVESR